MFSKGVVMMSDLHKDKDKDKDKNKNKDCENSNLLELVHGPV
jgi:hypothetical protein